MQIILLEQVIKRRAANAQQLGRVRDIALTPGERMADQLAIGRFTGALEVERLLIRLVLVRQVKIGCAQAGTACSGAAQNSREMASDRRSSSRSTMNPPERSASKTRTAATGRREAGVAAIDFEQP